MDVRPEQLQINFVVDSLERSLGEIVDHETLEAVVEADFSRFADAPIRDFVPVLVEKDVRARLIRRRAG